MGLSLSNLSIVLGLGLIASQWAGLTKPAAYVAWLKKFPRSLAWGVALTLAATAWFLYYLSQESIADLASYKGFLYVLFGGVGIGTCIFVQDLLAVRGLALVFLMTGKLMVDTGRTHLPDTRWVLVVQTLAYVLVLAGMWLTISPWRLRDWIDWVTAKPGRVKAVTAIVAGVGLFLAVLGFTIFRGLS